MVLLKDIKFRSLLHNGYIGLIIMQNGKTIAEGFIGDVLKTVPHLANYEVIEQRPYFNEWVIEISTDARWDING